MGESDSESLATTRVRDGPGQRRQPESSSIMPLLELESSNPRNPQPAIPVAPTMPSLRLLRRRRNQRSGRSPR